MNRNTKVLVLVGSGIVLMVGLVNAIQTSNSFRPISLFAYLFALVVMVVSLYVYRRRL